MSDLPVFCTTGAGFSAGVPPGACRCVIALACAASFSKSSVIACFLASITAIIFLSAGLTTKNALPSSRVSAKPSGTSTRNLPSLTSSARLKSFDVGSWALALPLACRVTSPVEAVQNRQRAAGRARRSPRRRAAERRPRSGSGFLFTGGHCQESAKRDVTAINLHGGRLPYF